MFWNKARKIQIVVLFNFSSNSLNVYKCRKKVDILFSGLNMIFQVEKKEKVDIFPQLAYLLNISNLRVHIEWLPNSKKDSKNVFHRSNIQNNIFPLFPAYCLFECKRNFIRINWNQIEIFQNIGFSMNKKKWIQKLQLRICCNNVTTQIPLQHGTHRNNKSAHNKRQLGSIEHQHTHWPMHKNAYVSK